MRAHSQRIPAASPERPILPDRRFCLSQPPAIDMIRARGSIAGSFRANYFARHYMRQSLTGPAAEPDPGSHKRPNGGAALGDEHFASAGWFGSCLRDNCCVFLYLLRRRSATPPLFGVVGLSCASRRSPGTGRTSARHRTGSGDNVSHAPLVALSFPAPQGGPRGSTRPGSRSLRAGSGKRATASPRQPGGFLRRIAQNLLIDRARRRKSAPKALFSLREESDAVTPATQEWNLEAADLLELYEKAVDAMPPKTRRVFLMHRVDELSYREIHEQLGISIATVEYHMMKALGRIAKVVDSEK